MRVKLNIADELQTKETALKMESLNVDVKDNVDPTKPVQPERFNKNAQANLMQALRNDDFERFLALMKEDINVDYNYDNQHTLLMEACWRVGGEKFAKKLLDANADPNITDSDGQTALHGAAYERNDKCMQLLLGDPRTNPNVLSALGYSPLHCATLAFWDNSRAGAHSRCIQMLLEQPRLEVNHPDKFGDSAVWNALQHPDSDAAQILKALLRSGRGRLNVDVWHVRNGASMRHVIEAKFPQLRPLLPARAEGLADENPHMRLLLQAAPDLETFRSLLPKDIDKWYGDPYYCTCLELACRRKDLQGFVKVLLDANADPNRPTQIYDIPVVHQAMANGNHEALKVLLSYEHVDFGVVNSCQHTALHIAAHRQCTTQEEEVEMQRCVNLVLGQKDEGEADEEEEAGACVRVGSRVDIHARDACGDTALHDAAHYGRAHVVLPLLRCGASALLRNQEGRTPLHFLDAAALRSFLDEQIRGSGQPRSEEYKITMRYNFLVPQEESLSEMDTVYLISRIRSLRELLQHPIITSFLELKWHLIRWFFYINLGVYIIFLALFTAYILIINEKYASNCTILKDEYTEDFPNFNFSGVSPILTECKKFSNYCKQNSTHLCLIDVNFDIAISILFLRILCFCLLTALSLMEIIQCAAGFRRYFTDSENLFEVLTLIVCACALSCDFSTSKFRQHISSISILMAWMELVLLSGRMPLLSIQLEVLKKVSFTFLRFMAWYSLIVVAFVLSFYILFRDGSGEGQKFFQHPGMTVLKTIAMMIGELEATNLEFQTVRITSHIIYLVFVFLMIVILMNVLSGLAVSDTQTIIDDAKVQRLVSLVKLISYFERMVLVMLSCCKKDVYQKYIQPMIRVFPLYARDKRIHLSKHGEVTFLRSYKGTKVQFEENFKIDNEIVGNAMKILSEKNQGTDMGQVMRLLNKLQEEMGKCQRIDIRKKTG